jgi:hypothetical protein
MKMREMRKYKYFLPHLIPFSLDACYKSNMLVGAGFTNYLEEKQTISINPPPSVAHRWENGITHFFLLPLVACPVVKARASVVNL